VASNKDVPDLGPKQRSPLRLVKDRRARVPGEVGAAAAMTPLWLLSSSSAVVAAYAPASLQSMGGAVQERGRRVIASTVTTLAHSRSWRERCWVRGCWRAVLPFSVDRVDWIGQRGGPDMLGAFPGRRSPKFATLPFKAGLMRGPQSSVAARKLVRVMVMWCLVSFEDVLGGDSRRRSMAFSAKGCRVLLVVSVFLEVLCVKCRDSWFSRVFCLVLRVVRAVTCF
jgi:hypothetical protein